MRARPLLLVVDDDPLFRKTLGLVLPRLGVDCTTADDARAFFDLSEKLRPDIHVIDLMLDGINGFTIIEKLRAKDPRAVIIVISGADDAESLTQALEKGADDFILKPLDLTLLASKLSRYVETDDLTQHRSEPLRLPEGGEPVKLSFGVEINEIDELGVGFVSPHLIPKTTVLKIKADLFGIIGSPNEEILVTVVTTSFDSSTKLYQAYAEFGDNQKVLVDAIRKWAAGESTAAAS